jgi:DNA polymerase
MNIDFETYSTAGYINNKPITHSPPHGLAAVGVCAYAEHPSTEIICLAYGDKLWKYGDPAPLEIFHALAKGEIFEAWNASFEYWIWHYVGHGKYGWPHLPLEQIVCSMARARAFSLPGRLGKAAEVLGTEHQKDAAGTRLINKYSKGEPRVFPEDNEIYDYCLQDVKTERNVSEQLPHFETDLWRIHEKINIRGVQIDIESLDALIEIVNETFAEYKSKIPEITQGNVKSISQIAAIKEWMAAQGVSTKSLNAATVDHLLSGDLPEPVRELLNIRKALALSSIKKLYAIKRRVSSDGRLRDMFIFHAAKTGRFGGSGPQPQNLPNKGPSVVKCACGRFYATGIASCPWCGELLSTPHDWDIHVVNEVLHVARNGGRETLERMYGDILTSVSGCLRGLFCAAPGNELICSDFSAIEAVVLAELSGEKWRQEVFRTHGRIYEISAEKITGVPFDPNITHPHRKIGKLAELASGYCGAIGAWKAFGAEKHMTDAEILDAVAAWREASPYIVSFWHQMEYCAKQAILYPGEKLSYNGITFQVRNSVLYCKLLSGREICYHKPRIIFGKIKYMGVNKSTWCELDTYGGRLTENVVQAVARDILANSIMNLENAGYSVVLHIHDEIVCDVSRGTLDIERFEKIMSELPDWCSDWPVRVSGGWIGQRYRK